MYVRSNHDRIDDNFIQPLYICLCGWKDVFFHDNDQLFEKGLHF